MPQPRIRRRRKPAKPYPSFPLTPHNNGQWCKKIRGKVHFFGVWEDPDAALENYLRVAEDLHAGRQPQQGTISADGPNVKQMCNQYLTYQLHRAESGEISIRWFESCRTVVEDFARFMEPGRLLSNLRPDDFFQYRQKLHRRGLASHKGLGVHALIRAVTVVRGMLKYAYESDLIDRPIKYGKGLERPSAALKRKSRKASEQVNGKRLFEADQIRAMLKAAGISLRAMVLLGINGGFGNTDCARLPITAVDWERALIEFDREKTGVERVVPLWPETIEALRRALTNRPEPIDEEAGRLLFLTAFGRPWVRETVRRSPENEIKRVIPVDSINQEFDKLLKKLGFKRKGLGFYALRHTFRTWADEVRDQHAIHRIMGHTIPGMSGIYVEEISLDRLRAVVNHVREKLFAEPQEPSAGAVPATT